MEKIKLENENVLKKNIELLKNIFPEAFSEDKVDFEALKNILGNFIETKERYSLNWSGKMEAKLETQKISKSTLLPSLNESKNFYNTNNLYIEGDNLEVIKLLQKSFYNKIDTIYIDPPYNTGNDIIYKNDYSVDLNYYKKITKQINDDDLVLTTNTETNGKYHSNWLSMMYPVLILARKLLTDQGIICLAIDHNELHSLALLCDEVFGRQNRLGLITVVSKPEGRNQEKFFATSTEYALFYSKNKSSCQFNSVILDDEIKKTFDRSDSKGRYRLNNYIRVGGGNDNLRINKPHFYYPIYVSKDLSKISLNEIPDGFVKYPNTISQERTWKTKKETFQERLEAGEILAEIDSKGEIQIYEKYREDKGQLIKTHWVDKKYNFITNGTNVLEKLMGGKTFDFPKSLYYVKDILNIISKNDGYILDFFSGSATTAHATMQLNAEDGGSRKYIMVQLPVPTDQNSEAAKAGYKNICEIGKERIRRAGEKVKSDETLPLENREKLDTGFKVFKLDTSNIKEWDSETTDLKQSLFEVVDNIKEDRTSLDVLYEILLKYGLDLNVPIVETKDFYSIGGGTLLVNLNKAITLDAINSICEEYKILLEADDEFKTTVVLRDSSFSNDVDKTNAIQKLKQAGIKEIRSI
ncbi:MAG: site-specific DNA-methyltransferase [Cetobacterium sp.]